MRKHLQLCRIVFGKVLVLCALFLAPSCHTQRHSVIDTEQHTETLRLQQSLQSQVILDSMLQSLSMCADSVIILVTPSAPVAEAGSKQPSNQSEQASLALTGSPSIRITAHNPQVKTERQSRHLVVAQQVEQDSAACSVQADIHADNSKEIVGVARPMNGTVVIVIVLSAVLLIAAIFLWLFLRKYKII